MQNDLRYLICDISDDHRMIFQVSQELIDTIITKGYNTDVPMLDILNNQQYNFPASYARYLLSKYLII
jgi:hypothetical protein